MVASSAWAQHSRNGFLGSAMRAVLPVPRVYSAVTSDHSITAEIGVDSPAGFPGDCELLLNSAVSWRGTCDRTQQVTVDDLPFATAYDLRLRVDGTFGERRTSKALSITTHPGPRAVEVGRGPEVDRRGCRPEACAWITVDVHNFPRNSAVSIVCRASGQEDGYSSFATRTDVTGSYSLHQGKCWYGVPGRDVWVTVNDVESAHYRW